VKKTIWPQCHIGAYVYHDYRPALQAESRPPISQLSWSVSMNPVNNWIQSNATSKFHVRLTSWPRRHIWLGRSCSQLISLDNSYSTCELKQTSILRSLYDIRNYGYLLRHDAASSHSSLPRLPAPWRHQPCPLSMTTRIGQSTPLQPLLRTKLQLRNCWIIVLIVWCSDWRYKVTFDDGYHCLSTNEHA